MINQTPVQNMDREISPPPLKRRRIVKDDDSQTATAMGSIRVFSWNINGIQRFLPASTVPITSFFKPVQRPPKQSSRNSVAFKASDTKGTSGNPLRAFLRRHNWPEVLFLQELKISASDEKTPSTLLAAVNAPLDSRDEVTDKTRYTLDVNLPRDRYNARGFGGKLYGVGTLLRKDFASKHKVATRHPAWDLEGRVAIVELQAQAATPGSVTGAEDPPSLAKPLALLNIYAVNGTDAPYRSPTNGAPTGQTRHDHKLRFHRLLRNECLALERDRGFAVVVAGDLNIARGPLDGHPGLRTWPRQHCVNRADFNDLFFGEEDNMRAEAHVGKHTDKNREETFDGVDVFRALRGKERRYTYHPPRDGEDWGTSCDRVDFIFCSKDFFEQGRVIKTDILDSPLERGTSDHVPLWVTLKFE